MSEPKKIIWPGKSGQTYTYYIYIRGTTFTDGLPGNYIHIKETNPGKWTPVYIGQTTNINDRLNNHEKEDCVDNNGATHVCVHINQQGDAARLAEEKDLILQWQPVCNVQHIR